MSDRRNDLTRLLMKTVHRAFAVLVATMLAGATSARADVLFVDSNNPTDGDGTAKNPFQKIATGDMAIRGALEEARLRFLTGRSQGTMVIHVRRGTYVVPPISYGPPLDASGPYEQVDAPPGSLLIGPDLPFELKIIGETEFSLDAAGRPIAPIPGTETIIRLESSTSLGVQQTIVRVTRGGVEIAGLVLDGGDVLPLPPPPPGDIFFNRAIDVDPQPLAPIVDIELISDILIHRNLVRGVVAGIQTRLTSATIQENLLDLFPAPGRAGSGMVIGAGTANQPAVVRILRNRSTGNFNGAVFQGVTSNTKPPVNADVAQDGALVVEIVGNDLTGNVNTGIRFNMLARKSAIRPRQRRSPRRSGTIPSTTIRTMA